MTLLCIGLALFLGVHLVPVLTPLRNALYERHGEKRYKGMFSAAAGLGLVLIVVGFAVAPAEPRVFDPWPEARKLAASTVTLSLILIAAANMKGYLRAWLKHPMLLGTIIWATVHLLANGELRTTLMFGGFLAWAVIDLVSAIARGAVKRFTPSVRFDLMAVVGGIVISLLIATFHRWLFGVAVVPWAV